MRRRALLIVATMVLGVVLLSGVALAKNITGTFGQDNLRGTNQLDRIYGLGAADTISGLGGPDDLYGGSGQDEVRARDGNDRIDGGFGSDELFGGGHNDTISAADGYTDNVNCGRGIDTAYVDRVDRVNKDCENVFVAGGQKPTPEPTPGVDKVSGTGVLGGDVGNPTLQVNAKSTGTNPDDAQGTFYITYPDAPTATPQPNTKVAGSIVCLDVTGNKARLVGRINSAVGPQAEGTNPKFRNDQYVRIGVLDNGNDDKANFSAGAPSFTSCIGEEPTLDVVAGSFVVKEEV
jgi:hypothetical protein